MNKYFRLITKTKPADIGNKFGCEIRWWVDDKNLDVSMYEFFFCLCFDQKLLPFGEFWVAFRRWTIIPALLAAPVNVKNRRGTSC